MITNRNNINVKFVVEDGEKSKIYVVYTPTNALSINLVKSTKFTLKYAIIFVNITLFRYR